MKHWIGNLPGTGEGVKASLFEVSFDWDDNIGVPGAIIVRNNHLLTEFFLKTIILSIKDIPGVESEEIVLVCNSWVYPNEKYDYERVFFTNKVTGIFLFFGRGLWKNQKLHKHSNCLIKLHNDIYIYIYIFFFF